MKKKVTLLLVLAMIFNLIPVNVNQAKSKVKLSSKSVSIKKGSTKTVKLSGLSGKNKVSWKVASKKIATIKVSGAKNQVCKIKGVKKGTTSVTAKYKKKKYKCKVAVKDKKKKVSIEDEDDENDEDDEDDEEGDKPNIFTNLQDNSIVTSTPTSIATAEPTAVITVEPTELVTNEPTEDVITSQPTAVITVEPTELVTTEPTNIVTSTPSDSSEVTPTSTATEYINTTSTPSGGISDSDDDPDDPDDEEDIDDSDSDEDNKDIDDDNDSDEDNKDINDDSDSDELDIAGLIKLDNGNSFSSLCDNIQYSMVVDTHSKFYIVGTMANSEIYYYLGDPDTLLTEDDLNDLDEKNWIQYDEGITIDKDCILYAQIVDLNTDYVYYISTTKLEVIGDSMSDDYIVYSNENLTAKQGGYIDVPIYIKENKGLLSTIFSLRYDADSVVPVSAERGNLVSNDSVFYSNIENATDDGEIDIFWAGDHTVTEDGLLCTVCFKVNKQATLGGTTIILTSSDEDTLYDEETEIKLNCNPVIINITTGGIPSPTPTAESNNEQEVETDEEQEVGASPAPTVEPTEEPSPTPTAEPTEEPSPTPTVAPNSTSNNLFNGAIDWVDAEYRSDKGTIEWYCLNKDKTNYLRINLNTIDNGIFENCLRLRAINLSNDSIIRLHDKAFAGCKNLKVVIIECKNIRLGKSYYKINGSQKYRYDIFKDTSVEKVVWCGHVYNSIDEFYKAYESSTDGSIEPTPEYLMGKDSCTHNYTSLFSTSSTYLDNGKTFSYCINCGQFSCRYSSLVNNYSSMSLVRLDGGMDNRYDIRLPYYLYFGINNPNYFYVRDTECNKYKISVTSSGASSKGYSLKYSIRQVNDKGEVIAGYSKDFVFNGNGSEEFYIDLNNKLKALHANANNLTKASEFYGWSKSEEYNDNIADCLNKRDWAYMSHDFYYTPQLVYAIAESETGLSLDGTIAGDNDKGFGLTYKVY